MTLALVLGGVRSGKSAHAQRLAQRTGLPVDYIATADSSDPEMAARIAAHVAARPAGWGTTDAGDELVAAVDENPESCALIDGLGTWIAGVMHRRGGLEAYDRLPGIREHVYTQLTALARRARERTLIVVAEQAGEGMLPLDAASRAWLDLLGEATQRLSGEADTVELIVAGRALALASPEAVADVRGKGSPRPGENAPIAAGDSLRRHGDRELAPGLRDHAVNVLDGGVPDWLSPVLADALAVDAERYPDERAAVEALAALHDRDPDEIVITNGAAEALWLLPAALRPQLAACVHPGFTESEAALHAHGVAVTRVLRDPDDDFALRPSTVPPTAELVITGNPVSPSGTLDPADTVAALAAPGRAVVVDEAFMGMVPREPESLAARPPDGVIVVRSMTKLLSIPGLRAGYAIAPAGLAARLRAVRPPWSVNAVALAALTAAAEHPAELAALAERSAHEGADLNQRLALVTGVRSWPTVTNFCLIEVADGPAVHRRLRDRGFAVRHAASFPGLGPGYLRLTARSADRNAALTEALREVIA